MSSTQYLIPKDPPSYESLYYQTIPSSSSSLIEENQSFSKKIIFAIKRYIHRHIPFLQTLTAAIFVAATVSATVMLLLWQLQNLASPQDPDDPWLDLAEY